MINVYEEIMLLLQEMDAFAQHVKNSEISASVERARSIALDEVESFDTTRQTRAPTQSAGRLA